MEKKPKTVLCHILYEAAKQGKEVVISDELYAQFISEESEQYGQPLYLSGVRHPLKGGTIRARFNKDYPYGKNKRFEYKDGQWVVMGEKP